MVVTGFFAQCNFKGIIQCNVYIELTGSLYRYDIDEFCGDSLLSLITRSHPVCAIVCRTQVRPGTACWLPLCSSTIPLKMPELPIKWTFTIFY